MTSFKNLTVILLRSYQILQALAKLKQDLVGSFTRVLRKILCRIFVTSFKNLTVISLRSHQILQILAKLKQDIVGSFRILKAWVHP